MIIGIIIGIVGTLVVGVIVALSLPRRKRDPDSYGRQKWSYEDED